MNNKTEPLDTKTRLIEVAESLFAEQGISSTSLRNIIAKAGVNIAAIHYHFGSKEALVQAVFARRLGPINRERLRLLDELEAGQTGGPSLEAIVAAFIEPVTRMKLSEPEKQETILKLFGQLMADTDEVFGLVSQQFEETGIRFIAALRLALPHLSKRELVWRFRFMIGALHTIMKHPPLPKAISGITEDEHDVKSVLQKVVTFLVAGFRAPATENMAEVK